MLINDLYIIVANATNKKVYGTNNLDEVLAKHRELVLQYGDIYTIVNNAKRLNNDNKE
jgi:hypothetical protein